METIRPAGLEEALDALDAHPGATILAGGTDLMVAVNYFGLRPEVVVALRRVPELKRLDDHYIGAGTTWARLQRARWPALAQMTTVETPWDLAWSSTSRVETATASTMSGLLVEIRPMSVG